MLTNEKIIVAGAGGLLGSKLVASILESNGSVVAADINVEVMKYRLRALGVDTKNESLCITQLDVTNESSCKLFFSTLEHITGAVNATYPRNRTYGAHFLDVSLASFNENLALHLGSAFLFSQQCAVYFKRYGTKMSLVNISSIYGVIAPKFEVYENTTMTMPVEYAAIKSAIIHLNRYVTAFINDSRFRVNSVSPGGIKDGQPEEFLEQYKKQTLGKGMLDVDNVIGTILFLLSEQSRYINGQNLVVDDGFSL